MQEPLNRQLALRPLKTDKSSLKSGGNILRRLLHGVQLDRQLCRRIQTVSRRQCLPSAILLRFHRFNAGDFAYRLVHLTLL